METMITLTVSSYFYKNAKSNGRWNPLNTYKCLKIQKITLLPLPTMFPCRIVQSHIPLHLHSYSTSTSHSSEIRGLCWKYFKICYIFGIRERTFFSFSLRATLFYSLMNALVYVDVRPRHSLGKK